MRLKEYRIKNGFTRREIAQVLDMSLFKYMKYEKKGKLGLNAISRLEYLYGVSLEDLMEVDYKTYFLSLIRPTRAEKRMVERLERRERRKIKSTKS